ncbi:ATP-binding protein [Croceicoccus sp. BE223]|uniref:sensor histidine kinase n=1 Tax=Croceicoccus sp. BE223 TaxID=2817716 RepID=UPI0028596071|nr:ATP-binding protein [Croceicoccus sp. BE223]MDR7103280.1 signal transduction histidine kinase [Croceicoccus sp. BE223]
MPNSAFRVAGGTGQRLIVSLLAVGSLLLVVGLAAAIMTMRSIGADTDAVEATLETQAVINRIAALNEQVETGRRGYLINGGDIFARTTSDALDALDDVLGSSDALFQSTAEQTARFADLEQLVEERAALVRQQLRGPAMRITERQADSFSTDRAVLITREIRALTGVMAEREKERLSQRNTNQYNSLKQFYAIAGILLLLLMAVMVTALVVVIRFNRALSAAEADLRRANEGLEEAVVERTTELRRANAEIQRFAYIVSHDLRSPLVNVLGFTSELEAAGKVVQAHLDGLRETHPDLATKELAYAVEEDLPEALGFIRTSTEKMDRLINSILELSRQGRRTLAPAKLDMNELVGAVVDTLYQRAHEEGASITVGDLPPVESDRMAVEQIMANLVENAIKYLSPDRAGEIRIEGGRERGLVHYDVIDNGRGIAPGDHDRVFELFRRSGKQDKPGEGIGLANVRALAYRLGGNVTVQSELDRGATFRLSLPIKFRAVEET